jgi:hypothetical protein
MEIFYSKMLRLTLVIPHIRIGKDFFKIKVMENFKQKILFITGMDGREDQVETYLWI